MNWLRGPVQNGDTYAFCLDISIIAKSMTLPRGWFLSLHTAARLGTVKLLSYRTNSIIVILFAAKKSKAKPRVALASIYEFNVPRRNVFCSKCHSYLSYLPYVRIWIQRSLDIFEREQKTILMSAREIVTLKSCFNLIASITEEQNQGGS